MCIYRFSPFSPQKELGKVYNAHCKIVPNDSDYIQISDYDSMFLTTKTYDVIEKAIAKHGHETAIFGVMTNRIGYPYQRIEALPDENADIRHHVKIAEDLAEKYKEGQCFESYSVAGFFMLFKKEFWQNNHFQDKIIDREGIFFDRNFCEKAKKQNKPLRIIKGAYLWHSYRLNKQFTDITHLE